MTTCRRVWLCVCVQCAYCSIFAPLLLADVIIRNICSDIYDDFGGFRILKCNWTPKISTICMWEICSITTEFHFKYKVLRNSLSSRLVQLVVYFVEIIFFSWYQKSNFLESKIGNLIFRNFLISSIDFLVYEISAEPFPCI